MRARIFQIPKTATQSGVTGAGDWALEFPPEMREINDPVTGWWGGGSTKGQLRLRFDTRESAVAYAEANSVAYEVEVPPPGKPLKPKAYADNFRYGRAENWTH